MSRFNQQIEVMEGIITKLEIQKKRKDRVNIYLNEIYAFSCHVDLIFEFKLDKGIEMNSAKSRSLIEADDQKMAYQYGLKIALSRQISIAGCRKKLMGYEFLPASIEAAIDLLVENDYLNDERFATYYFEIKQPIYGRFRIQQELNRQGIDKALIQKIISAMADDDQEFDEALRLGRKKMEQQKGPLDHKLYAKIYGLLSRKGYSSSVLRRVMDHLRTESYQVEDAIDLDQDFPLMDDH